MMQGARLAALLPHEGAMVLLDAMVTWNAEWLQARSRAHLCPTNPLRRNNQLGAVCGVEFALQAAALHGAMRDGGKAQKPGYVARLRDVTLHIDRLDDPALGTLAILARLEHAEAGGMVYQLEIDDVMGRRLVEARASIALPGKTGPA